MSIAKQDNTRLCFLLNTMESINKAPQPTIAWQLTGEGGFIVAYDINGYFKKPKHVKYLRDVTKRFEQTYDCKQTDIEPVTQPYIFNGFLYDLCEVAKDLERLNKRIKTFSHDKQNKSLDDELFKKAQIVCNHLIRDFGSFTQQELYLAIKHDLGGTESEAKAKSKNMYRYFKNRNWKPVGRVHEMSRSENAKKQSKLKAIEAKNKVRSVVESMKFLNEKITYVSVAKASELSRPTATKYLNELKEEGVL